jgi:hypothetical protein
MKHITILSAAVDRINTLIQATDTNPVITIEGKEYRLLGIQDELGLFWTAAVPVEKWEAWNKGEVPDYGAVQEPVSHAQMASIIIEALGQFDIVNMVLEGDAK